MDTKKGGTMDKVPQARMGTIHADENTPAWSPGAVTEAVYSRPCQTLEGFKSQVVIHRMKWMRIENEDRKTTQN
jgi:hypothetical protein